MKTAALVATLTLAGCATTSPSPADASRSPTFAGGERALTMINSTPYQADMKTALAGRGIDLKPPPDGVVITPFVGPSFVHRRSPSTRYGIDLQVERTRQVCSSGGQWLVDAKVTVIDLRNDAPVAVFQQLGADVPCQTVESVFSGLAAGIAGLWGAVAP